MGDADPAPAAGAEAAAAAPAGTTASPHEEVYDMPNFYLPYGEGRQDNSTATMGFDQSHVWMMQLVILVATMTLFFPFLRKLLGIKSPKRRIVNYSSYDSEVCDESEDDNEDYLENEECCNEE